MAEHCSDWMRDLLHENLVALLAVSCHHALYTHPAQKARLHRPKSGNMQLVEHLAATATSALAQAATYRIKLHGTVSYWARLRIAGRGT